MNDIISSEMNKFGINNFLNLSQKYSNSIFPNLNINNVFDSALNGDIYNAFKNNVLSNIFLREIKDSINLMASIVLIVIIHTIFKTIVDGLKNSESGKIVYFIQYLLIVTLIINSFISILDLTKNTINDLSNYMNILIPLMVTLIITTGSFTTANVFQPFLVFLVSFMGNFIIEVIIPILLISISFSIVSSISEKVQIDKLSKILKSSIVWILGILLTIFTSILSLEGTLSSGVDGLTTKTTKAAVSNIIPVVGKIVCDTTDSVIGCTNILKNSVGIIGIIIIVCIVAIPVLKILSMWFSFKLTAVICDAIADIRITKLMEQIADAYKILLGVLASISVMFIIGLTLVIKITNSVMMYR